MTDPLQLLREIEVLILGQRLNIAKVEANAVGVGQAKEELRRVANEIRLKAAHYRALTSPSLDPKDAAAIDAQHLKAWAVRKGISGKV